MDPSKRRVVIAGNWKMNKTPAQAAELIGELKGAIREPACDVILCVPFTDLQTAVGLTSGTPLKVGAQNLHFEKSGAFTGEVSAPMLKEIGAEYVIIGHSERREYFGETNETVNKKIFAALEEGLKVILCVGETLAQRESGITREWVSLQVKAALCGIDQKQMKDIIIAYEPIWAIGTGKTATAGQAEEVCFYVREAVSELYGLEIAQGLTIQYGGSMNAKNAKELLMQYNVDGGLIGGASLKAADFAAIVGAAK